MTRMLAITAAVALLVFAATYVHRYSGLNAGVFIELPGGHWCGIEYRGDPGPFCDSD